MKALSKWCLLAFAVGLGGTVAYRMSAEAMAVVIGVVCGVLASVLMSALMWALAHSWSGRSGSWGEVPRRADYPPVVVIQPGAPPRGRLGYDDPFADYLPGLAPEKACLPARPGAREFNVVGQAEVVPGGDELR